MSAREITPGLWRIQLPLPFDLDSVNVHLIKLPEGWMLVDTGLGNERCYQTLLSGLAEAAIAISDIRLILLTHTHPDHLGLATRLHRETGARLTLHRREQEILTLIDGSAGAFIDQLLAAAGAPEERLGPTRQAFVELRKTFKPVPADYFLEDGDLIETALGPLEIVWTPGHAPGHVCLFFTRSRTLISGDHLLEKITPNIGWFEGRDNLRDYLASLSRIEARDVHLVLPSHGQPFVGHRQRAAATRTHHDTRCRLLETALGSDEFTSHQLVGTLWPRELSPFNYRFALDEILAHLEYLRGLGRVAVRREGPLLYWRASAGPAA